MKKLVLLAFGLILLLLGITFSMQFFSRDLFGFMMGKIPVLRDFQQETFKTYTSITGIQDSMKLVTAKQQLDFINIMDGKDGRYLEVATYEIKAGLDFSKITYEESGGSGNDGKNGGEERKIILPPVEIFSSDKIHTLSVRTNAESENSQFYSDCIRPVNIAYEQKSKDYAVELGILEKARENAEETLKNLTGNIMELSPEQYKTSLNLSYLPLQLEIAGDYLEKNKMRTVKLREDIFNRDALVFEDTANQGWKIRIGDTGCTFKGKFDDFYKNVFQTNTKNDNEGRDRVEIFRYFDPLYPRESEILSYASDSFRTFFVLNEGRIYYVDAIYENEQTLLDSISPSMVYFASSLRKINGREIENSAEYHRYIEGFFELAESLRKNDDRNIVRLKTDNLIKSNLPSLKNELANGAPHSLSSLSYDEKLLNAFASLKNLGRDGEEQEIPLTDDEELNDITKLIYQLEISGNNFALNEVRENAIKIATALNEKIKKAQYVNLALNQYLENWFLQNAKKFNLSEADKKRYENDLNSGEIFIASRPLISLKSDAERNRYFYNLLRNRLSMSHFYVDTASKIDDSLSAPHERGNLTFVYYNIPKYKELTDGEVLERMKKMNDGHDLDNAFILVFNQREWDFGSLGVDDDIHALLFDDAVLRLFPNVGSQNFIERGFSSLTELGKKFFNVRNVPEYFFYGDWKKLHVSAENVRIAGQNFGTKKISRQGKDEYRHSNDYAEKSTIAHFIDDLQHAYSENDVDYYYDTLCEQLNLQVQHYVYGKVFRPSPRMILEVESDTMHRYNY